MRTRIWQALVGMVIAALVGVIAPSAVWAAPTAPAAGPRYRIINTEGRCLDGNNPNGLYIWQCVTANNQYWYFDFQPGGYWAYIRNDKTGRCIRYTSFDGPVVTGACDGNSATLWHGTMRQPDPAGDWHTLESIMIIGACMNGPSSANGSGLFMNACWAPPWPTNYWSWRVV